MRLHPPEWSVGQHGKMLEIHSFSGLLVPFTLSPYITSYDGPNLPGLPPDEKHCFREKLCTGARYL
jgi:hypothetical protein